MARRICVGRAELLSRANWNMKPQPILSRQRLPPWRGENLAHWILFAFFCLGCCLPSAQASTARQELIQARLAQEYGGLFELYKHLHAHPELSWQEEKTSARVADELRKNGCEVASGLGKHGLV